MPNFYKSQPVTGLGTTTFTAKEAGTYAFDGKISHRRSSRVQVVVNKNGTPVLTGQAGAQGFHVEIPLAINDVVTIVLSSSLDIDKVQNVIKTNITISQL